MMRGLMGLEIERKFLIPTPPDLSHATVRSIDQGYVAITDDVEVRVRRIGDRTVLTAKQGSGGVRREEELDIPEATFAGMWAMTEGRRVEKDRHVLELGGVTIEVDVYRGDLAGLIVAEVEFASEEDSAAFVPPAWFGAELTGDKRYANQSLATAGRPT